MIRHPVYVGFLRLVIVRALRRDEFIYLFKDRNVPVGEFIRRAVVYNNEIVRVPKIVKRNKNGLALYNVRLS